MLFRRKGDLSQALTTTTAGALIVYIIASVSQVADSRPLITSISTSPGKTIHVYNFPHNGIFILNVILGQALQGMRCRNQSSTGSDEFKCKPSSAKEKQELFNIIFNLEKGGTLTPPPTILHFETSTEESLPGSSVNEVETLYDNLSTENKLPLPVVVPSEDMSAENIGTEEDEEDEDRGMEKSAALMVASPAQRPFISSIKRTTVTSISAESSGSSGSSSTSTGQLLKPSQVISFPTASEEDY